MKKISLSKETLRVLTAQEAEQVAGGLPPSTRPVERCPAPVSNNPDTCNPTTGACPTVGCPPPNTTNCPPNTTNCPPNTTSPTRPQARCPACPL